MQSSILSATPRTRRIGTLAVLAAAFVSLTVAISPSARSAPVFDEFPIPTAGAGPIGITTGPDGNLWFTEYLANKIGRITPSGTITEFPVPTADSRPSSI